MRPRAPAPRPATAAANHSAVLSFIGQAIGRSRYVVLLAVVAVLMVALSLFVLAAVMAATALWKTWKGVFSGDLSPADLTALTVHFLEIVSMMLKAVVFYLIGVGLYSLFIAPLNVTAALGVETLGDLESKVVSVVVVIMAVTFLEHFIEWEKPAELLQHAAALALVVAVLVAFQFYNHRAKEDHRANAGADEEQAKREMFHGDREEREVTRPVVIEGEARIGPEAHSRGEASDAAE